MILNLAFAKREQPLEAEVPSREFDSPNTQPHKHANSTRSIDFNRPKVAGMYTSRNVRTPIKTRTEVSILTKNDFINRMLSLQVSWTCLSIMILMASLQTLRQSSL